MPADLNFLDIVVLERIQGETVMEKFSGELGSFFLETAELMGNMKKKGLIEFVESGVSRSVVKRTEAGEAVLRQADMKITEHLDELDHAVIKSIAAGTNEFNKMQEQMNVRSEDLAYRCYKVTKQGYADYTIRNMKTFLTLTESGFKLVGFMPRRAEKQEPEGIPGITQPAPAPAKPQSKGVEMVMGEDDATKHLPPSKGPVDIKQKQAELQTMRTLKTIAIVVVLIAAAYLAAKYLGYV
jgi:hypothetical protein